MHKSKWKVKSDGSCLILLFLPLLILSGCVTDSRIKRNIERANAANYAEVARYAEDNIGNRWSKKTDLFWALQAASARRNLGHYDQSNTWFDIAEKQYKAYNEDSIFGTAVSKLAAILINDKVTAYKGEVYDGVLINTYKAINYLALGDYANARVEFNRALDRQRRAKTAFAKEIQARKAELAKSKHGEAIIQSIASDETQSKLKARYSNLDNFKAYSDFVNPYTTYMSGLFYGLQNDRSKAVDTLKEAYAMTMNTTVQEDLVTLSKEKHFNDSVWVIFENGAGPSKTEFRIDLPIFVATDRLDYIGVSFPQLQFNDEAFSKISVSSGNHFVATEQFADMDAVVANEFKKDLPAIQVTAITAAITKTLAQYALKEKYGTLGDIFALLQFSTTASDIRMWTSLPKNFQVARVPMPQDGMLKLKFGSNSQQVTIGEAANAIVSVRIPSKYAKPAISVMRFE